ncbi:MAG: hypothetical protein U0802_22000 [Candidatus Binatia bacterium]
MPFEFGPAMVAKMTRPPSVASVVEKNGSPFCWFHRMRSRTLMLSSSILLLAMVVPTAAAVVAVELRHRRVVDEADPHMASA